MIGIRKFIVLISILIPIVVHGLRFTLRMSANINHLNNIVKPAPIVSERILKQLNAFCGLHGLMYTDGHLTWTPAPLSLFPCPFPRNSFEFAQSIQPIWNKLIDRISRDRTFITKELSSVGDADSFTLRLLKLFETVPDTIVASNIQFGILRSDYMVNFDHRPLQVEINTISSSFGCLSQKVSLFHKHLLNRNIDSNEIQGLIKSVVGENWSPRQLSDSIVENHSLELISASIAAAHKAYENKNAIVLFIVQPNERNVSCRLHYNPTVYI